MAVPDPACPDSTTTLLRDRDWNRQRQPAIKRSTACRILKGGCLGRGVRMNVYYCRRTDDQLGGTRSTTFQKGRRAFALANAQAQYAPDRLCDVVHIALTLHLDLARKTLFGKCATTVRGISEAVSCLSL